jgi:hypothetical protein
MFSKVISNFIGLTTLTIQSFRLWSFWDVTPKVDRYSTNTELNFDPENGGSLLLQNFGK